jgi:methylenetetrahydrofolate dehydrogenase (NADP+)/methenyltetrahydrofolate cyclohydrolase
MVQLPLPNVDYERVVSAISPEKDVEGVHPYNLGRTLLGNEHLVPCTPLAVIRILQHEKITLSGKHVVIVNHSAIVGKPLSILMLNRNATVTVCHVYTENLARHTQQADILVTGAGVKGLITPEHVKRGVTLIDVAIILEKNGLCGDVRIDGMDGIVGSLTPVPGGVGPVTVACMLENVLIAAGLEKN